MLDRFDWIAKAKTRTAEADALVTRIVSRFPATFRECSEGDAVGHDFHYVTEALEEYPISEFANFSEAEREDTLAAAAITIDPSGGRLWTRRVPVQRKTSSVPVRLLVARDHFYGRGHTHLFIEQTGRTPCGLTRETCPGSVHTGVETDINWGGCRNAIERQRQRSNGRAPFDTS